MNPFDPEVHVESPIQPQRNPMRTSSPENARENLENPQNPHREPPKHRGF